MSEESRSASREDETSGGSGGSRGEGGKDSESGDSSQDGDPGRSADSKSGSGSKEQKQQKKDQEKGESGSGESAKGPSTLEWAVGIGSALLVLTLLGFVVYEVFSGTHNPPLVVVRVERILEAPEGYVVEVGAYNEGGATAKSLIIQGALKRDSTTVETSTATISYVPAETEREAGLFFSKDPREYTLEVRPKGYDRP